MKTVNGENLLHWKPFKVKISFIENFLWWKVQSSKTYDGESKKCCKDQESIQSSTTPDPEYHMGKWQKHN